MQLNKDYSKPIKRGEFPDVEDVKFLFLTLNLSREECARICNCNPEKIKIVCQQNKFQKTREQKTELRQQTNLKKYGVKNVSQLTEVKQKKKDTWKSNYGVDNPTRCKQIYNKIKETCKIKYGVDSTNSLACKKQKISQTLIEKYHKNNIQYSFKNNTSNTRQKRYNIKKQNNLFNTSKPELQIKQLLEKYFIVNYQYKSQIYPFDCDFYLPELDLYIEYQGSWIHGNMPFKNIDICLKQLTEWQEKAKISKIYENAIDTWTRKDPNKRKIAEENNLNWLEFFNMTEFNNWYQQVCEILK